ncbi:DNA-binding helix-turn-helix protein [Limosilactobacillus coleohominis 101-4-CHN]|mgnify:FL=1|uniref:DNA-binding helix-turn-helix protein n=2 Tax=Limosilactobacillus coleohominis TaxID=181675 RepID=C7XWN3_9LACO|nr:DNA-binding helix-turn-helix protein [Limosilactobacillus coleohominis 101-4-CHN]
MLEGDRMKLKGEKLRNIRRKRGLSQTALSVGICTQATISLMEKQDRIPKMNILTAICGRLDIDVSEIVEDDNNSMTLLFDQIENAVVHENYADAKKMLTKIKVKNLENEFDKQRYYYLVGMYQVETDQVDDAIFNFELILTQFSTMSANIYWALTTVGMAIAYEKLNNQARALKFVQRAVSLIDEKQMTGGQRQWQVIYRNIAELYISLKQWKDAIKMAQRGIKICRENESFFLLDNYYYLIAQAQMVGGQRQAAKDSMVIAKNVALAADDQDLVKKIG